MLNNLTPSQTLRYLFGTLSALVLLAAAEWLAAPALFPRVSTLIGIWILVGLAFLIYRKLIINFQDQRNEVRKGIQQVEPLLFIHEQLPLRAPLPPLRSYAASPDFLALMIELVKTHKPQTIVELGSGTTTLINGYLLQQAGGGRVYALDHEAEFAQQTRDNLVRHQVEACAEVLHAPLTKHTLQGKDWSWYETRQLLAKIETIDLLVVDGPPAPIQPQARYPALPLLFERLSPGAHVLVDDCIRRDDRTAVGRWVAEFPGLERTDHRLEKGGGRSAPQLDSLDCPARLVEPMSLRLDGSAEHSVPICPC